MLGAAIAALVTYYVVKSLNKAELAVVNERLASAERQVDIQKASADAQIRAAEKKCEDMVAALKDQYDRSEEQRKQQAERELTLAREKMKSEFDEQLRNREEQFKKTNSEQMANVVDPLKRQLEELRKLVHDTKADADKSTGALHEAVKSVIEHDRDRDKVTQSLADALKNRGKVQGDWGEQVLTNILNDSGLREGKEYIVQMNVKDSESHNLRPDVVVRLSDGANIIIDSKVSLTAYTDYVGAETEDDRNKAIKENYDSIWKHVIELSDKKYEVLVKDSVPIVFMFVPNEGSYILAMNKNPQLVQNAYKKGIIIINPTNLMLALDLVMKTWQNTRQEENVQNIIKAAEDLYDKYVGFTESYIKIGERLDAAKKSYDAALGQLKDGRGNISGRVKSLLKYGAKSNKTIPQEVASVELPSNEIEE